MLRNSTFEEVKVRNNLIAVLVFAVIFGKSAVIYRCFSLNVADVIMNRMLWTNKYSSHVSFAAELASDLYGLVAQISGSQPRHVKEEYCSSVCHLMLAQRSRRVRAFGDVQSSLEQFASQRVASLHPIRIPRDVVITPKGHLVLDFDSLRWYPRQDSTQEVEAIEHNDGIRIIFKGSPVEQDKIVFTWEGELPIHYWKSMHISAQANQHLLMHVEIHSNDGITRYLHAVDLENEWSNFDIQIEEEMIKYLYLTFLESGDRVSAYDYEVKLRPVVLSLKE